MRWSVAALALLLTGCAVPVPKTPALQPQQNGQTQDFHAVMIGDSITFRWLTDGQWLPFWIGKGIIGNTSTDLLGRFKTDVLALNPQTVHILVGTNDMYVNYDESQSESNLRGMIAEAEANNIHVILGTIPPWGQGWLATAADPDIAGHNKKILVWNDFVRSLASSKVCVVDYYSKFVGPDGFYLPQYSDDGIHPNELGDDWLTANLIGSLCLDASALPMQSN